MGFDKIKVKFLCNNIKLVTLKSLFALSLLLNSASIFFVEKPLGNMLCFDSEVDQHWFSLDNQTFSLNPYVRALRDLFTDTAVILN